MGRAHSLFFLASLILVCSLSFAEVEWSASAIDAVNGKIIVESGRAMFSSYSGNVYALNPDTGGTAWSYNSGEKIVLEAQLPRADTLAVLTGNGTLLMFAVSDGKLKLAKRFDSAPLSFAAGEDKVFIAFKSSVVALNMNGQILWNSSISGNKGQIGYNNGVIYFTSDGTLYALSALLGNIKWATHAEDSFMSRPSYYYGTVYFGATDGRLYAVDYVTGRVRWAYKTGGWVMSTPKATQKSVYFGSNDGYLYSLTASGALRYRFKTNEGIWTEPELYESSGKTTVVFGSNDGKLYGVDDSTGEEEWSFSAYGKPNSPALYKQSFIFGTGRGKIYDLSLSPICSFSYPRSEDAVGGWPVEVEGKASSDAGISGVEVRVDKGPWIQATGKENWYAAIDFAAVPLGAVEVECRARDRGGKIESNEYSYVTLVRSDTVPLQSMFVSAPSEVASNDSILLFARDSRGKNIRNLQLTIGENEPQTGDSPFSIVLGKSGPANIILEKPGFESVGIVVVGKGDDLLMPILLAIAIIVVLYFLVLRRFIAFVFKKKK